MRLATVADMPELGRIAISTLRTAYPNISFDVDDLHGLREQLTRSGVLVCVTDDVSAFILSERVDNLHWWVRFLMPLDMGAQTGKDLIGFALRREHAVRPIPATCETFARLNMVSQVERGTASSYKTILTSNSRNLLLPARPVLSLSETGTTARATVENTKPLQVGMSVVVSGSARPKYNGTFMVSAVTPTTFSYTAPSGAQNDPNSNATYQIVHSVEIHMTALALATKLGLVLP